MYDIFSYMRNQSYLACGFDLRLIPDVITFNSLISACERGGLWQMESRCEWWDFLLIWHVPSLKSNGWKPYKLLLWVDVSPFFRLEVCSGAISKFQGEACWQCTNLTNSVTWWAPGDL